MKTASAAMLLCALLQTNLHTQSVKLQNPDSWTESEMLLDRGKIYASIVTIQFNSRMIDFPEGVTSVIAADASIRNQGVKSILDDLNRQFGAFTIVKAIPRGKMGRHVSNTQEDWNACFRA